MIPRYQALRGRIEEALGDVERVVMRAEELLEKATTSGDDGYFDGIALNLHGFYAGLERIFEDIARSLEQTVPVRNALASGLIAPDGCPHACRSTAGHSVRNSPLPG